MAGASVFAAFAGRRAQRNAGRRSMLAARRSTRRSEKLLAAGDAAAARALARGRNSSGQRTACEKGDWGLADRRRARRDETLYEQNADNYFVPASNMKLFTTALALAKLGPDYRFHTTLETRGTFRRTGTLSGPLFLVGRGDPNLSNRKFPLRTEGRI